MYCFSILRSLQIIKHKLPSFNFSHINDSFYETHLINVPLDLFSPACKEEEYCSLDRKESIKLKTMISACSAAWCFKIYCVAQLSARQWFSNYFWGITKIFPFLVWYTLCQSSEFVLWDGQECGQKAEWRVGHRLHLKRRFIWCKGSGRRGGCVSGRWSWNEVKVNRVEVILSVWLWYTVYTYIQYIYTYNALSKEYSDVLDRLLL